MNMKDFLETVPPYQEVEIEDINTTEYIYSEKKTVGNCPDIFIYCEECDGERFFSKKKSPDDFKTYNSHINFIYYCKNCNISEKLYSLYGRRNSSDDTFIGKIMKIGEFPVFGKPIPSRLISLVGPDNENFLKGRRCENQGFGIGSYSYYRRVVESQKDRIIDQIIKICEQYKQYDKNSELIKQLKLAKNETQFSKAVDMIKKNLPNSLLINGHNPLKLLHTALSKGIHEMTDDECLNKANSIRIVLIQLCLRINELLDDNNELKKAVDLLLKPTKEPSHA